MRTNGHEGVLTLKKSGDTNNDFHRVSERRVEQASQSRSQLGRHLFGRLTQELMPARNLSEV